MKSQVDIGVITVKPEERDALLDLLQAGPPDDHGTVVAKVPNMHGGDLTVAVPARTRIAGSGAAHTAADALIHRYQPQWIGAIGMCGAVPDADWTLGDVLLATSVYDFRVGKDYPGGKLQRSNRGGPLAEAIVRLGARLSDVVPASAEWTAGATLKVHPPVTFESKNFHGPKRWRDRTRKALDAYFGEAGRWDRPKVVAGPFAGDDTMHRDPVVIQDWLKSASDLAGIEMELCGLYEVSRPTQDRSELPVLCLKGISDIVGFERNPEWIRYACRTAASCFITLLSRISREFLVPRSVSGFVGAAAINPAPATIPKPAIPLTQPAASPDIGTPIGSGKTEFGLDPDPTQEQAILELCWPAFHKWGATVAHAVRLVGASDEHFPPDRIAISIDPQDYSVPEPLRLDEKKMREIEQAASDHHIPLWNGPCVRLVDCSASARGSSEEKYLNLRLGRMTWYDYVMANQRFGDRNLAEVVPTRRVTDFVDFNTLAQNQDIRASRLCNILTVYVTATTSDGFLVYSERSGRVFSHRNIMISAVSENLHPQKDHVFGSQTGECLFLGAARGIREEISPELEPQNPTRDMYLIGIEFHLQGCHPGLLFYLPFSETRAQVEQACGEFQCTDFSEKRKLEFVDLDSPSDIESALSGHEWFSAGKASVIRTLEFLVASGRDHAPLPRL